MIKIFGKAWVENKDKLEEYFRNTKQEEYDSYEKIVKKLFEFIINPYLKSDMNCEIYYPLGERI